MTKPVPPPHEEPVQDGPDRETVDWSYETATDLDQGPLRRLENFPREPDFLVYGLRSMFALGLRAYLKIFHRLTIRGRANIPDCSFVMVANHQSHLDALALISALPLHSLHRAFPAAAKDYFFANVPRIALAAVVVNALPFDREAKGMTSLRMCRALLKTPGNILILFPEGTRSMTGDIGTFLPGIGMILAGTDVSVVPCRLFGAERAWPKGRRLPRPRRVSMTIGEPVSFGDRKRGKASAMAIARELEEAVRRLT